MLLIHFRVLVYNVRGFCVPDPFADATKGDDRLPAGTEDYIHIRIQQRNGRKTLTTVQGIADDYDKKKLVKAFKKVGALLHCSCDHKPILTVHLLISLAFYALEAFGWRLDLNYLTEKLGSNQSRFSCWADSTGFTGCLIIDLRNGVNLYQN